MNEIKLKKPNQTEMCPPGYHVVKGHQRVCHSGTKTWVDAHIRRNRGKKTMYLPENLLYEFWNNLNLYPSLNFIKGFSGNHSIDSVIQFWLEFWQKQGVKFPDGLTPLHIKAMIAVESSFNPSAKSKTSTATGLMQILEKALGPLKGEKRKNWRELNNNYVSVSLNDLEDPVINIAVGTRWLAHNYYLLRNQKDKSSKATIRAYHSKDKAGDKYAEKVLKLYEDSK